MDRTKYLMMHLNRTRRLEAKYFPATLNAVKSQVDMFVSVLRQHGVDAAMKLTLPQGRLAKIIRDIYETVGLFYARKTLREVESETKAGFGINEDLIARILEYLLSNLLRDVATITQTVKDVILTILKQGQQEGWGVDRMAREIVQADIPMKRARVIVRTELVKAMNAGQQAGKNESAWEMVDEWVSAEDARVRPSHAQIDGFKVRGDEKFPVKRKKGGFDMMTGPGDPEASAENVINCRCAKVSRVARDENGRPIRKRKISVILPGQVKRPLSTTLI